MTGVRGTTLRRVVVLGFAIVLAVALALGAWGDRSQRLGDDDYVAIALSQPDVFHPRGVPSSAAVSARVAERADTYVAVDVTSEGVTFRVFIDPRSNRVTQVVRR